jgi:CelD/BcsL family acetyltransferase involved in cellulose biosynthesis
MSEVVSPSTIGSRNAQVRARRLSGFEDPDCSAICWQRLLSQSDTDVVFLTKEWLEAWWTTVGQGELLLIAAEQEGEVIAIAPLFALEGMVFFLGAGESDYLDFIGNVHDPEVMSALLGVARDWTPEFVGFKLHLVPDRSRTNGTLQRASQLLGMICCDEAELPAVEVALADRAEDALAAVSRGMLARERYCRRRGVFEVRGFRDLDEIREQLAEFYAQHITRWQIKGLPSPFSDAGQRAFLERFLELAAKTGWIRFLRIDWRGRAIAFEFAWYYRGTHYSGPWCFAVECANRSPGQILLRRSVLAALGEGIETYDLGTGDQEYKLRLPARTFVCRTWSLYPP